MSSTTEREPPVDVDATIDRLSEAHRCASDADLVRALGLTPGAVANWRKRGTIPYSHLVETAVRGGWSLDWLMLGRGSPRAWIVREKHAPGYVTARLPPARGVSDPRLAAVLAWWSDWWDSQDAETRAWALVQLRRAIPESAEWMRHWLRRHQVEMEISGPPSQDGATCDSAMVAGCDNAESKT